MTCGSSASTTVPAPVARTTTLHGRQRPDAAADAQHPVGGRRVAGAQGDVVPDLLAEVGAEGGGDVDLGQHAEPLVFGAARTRATASANGTSMVTLLP
jgi:hypothetical protein